VSSADDGKPLTAAEARSLFASLAGLPGLILAVSGGPDSTALLWLAARWRKARKRGPRLVAVTVDHGLRPQARIEAKAVARLARSFGVSHRIEQWSGRKRATGLQAAARQARYRLLAKVAAEEGIGHVLTAHTLDDQAETVLIRLARGSGIGGLAAMAREAPWPSGKSDVTLVRPFLDVPKARLVTTLRKAGIAYSDDSSNRDPRFTRVRIREAMPVLSGEGLTADRLATLAMRARRVESALEATVSAAQAEIAPGPWPEQGPVSFATAPFDRLPAEIALRLLGRAVAATGNEGPVELAKLEALMVNLAAGQLRCRRTLAGAVVTRANGRIVVERAPPRHVSASKRP
jgi:tRNA(Ile)-lysidine synthase